MPSFLTRRSEAKQLLQDRSLRHGSCSMLLTVALLREQAQDVRALRVDLPAQDLPTNAVPQRGEELLRERPCADFLHGPLAVLGQVLLGALGASVDGAQAEVQVRAGQRTEPDGPGRDCRQGGSRICELAVVFLNLVVSRVHLARQSVLAPRRGETLEDDVRHELGYLGDHDGTVHGVDAHLRGRNLAPVSEAQVVEGLLDEIRARCGSRVCGLHHAHVLVHLLPIDIDHALLRHLPRTRRGRAPAEAGGESDCSAGPRRPSRD